MMTTTATDIVHATTLYLLYTLIQEAMNSTENVMLHFKQDKRRKGCNTIITVYNNCLLANGSYNHEEMFTVGYHHSLTEDLDKKNNYMFYGCISSTYWLNMVVGHYPNLYRQYAIDEILADLES